MSSFLLLESGELLILEDGSGALLLEDGETPRKFPPPFFPLLAKREFDEDEELACIMALVAAMR